MSGRLHRATSMVAPGSQVELSFSERKAKKGAYAQRPSRLVEGSDFLRPIDRAPPGETVRGASKTQPRAELARQKSKRNFFEDAFSMTPSSPARDRVHGDAIVMAEVKTNVIISDEFAFITELSYHLSSRYQRPVSSIVVTLHHGACMFFAGSLEPAYTMAVFALPGQLKPATNKRNAALIQKHMEDTLRVPPARGLLRFVPTPEEHLACGGKTLAGEIDELERSFVTQEGGAGYGATLVRTAPPAVIDEEEDVGSWWGNMAKRKSSVRALAPLRHSAPVDMPTPELTPPGSDDGTRPPVLRWLPASASRMADEAGRVVSPAAAPIRQPAQRKKSFVASIFGRPGSKSVVGGNITAGHC